MRRKIISIYNFVDKQSTLIIYLFYLILIGISSIIFCLVYSYNNNIVDLNNNIILKNIDFGHGQLIHNLYYEGTLNQKFNGLTFYLKKTLSLPIIIYLLSKISLNYIFIITAKNLIMYSIYFYICNYYRNYNNKSTFIFLLLLIVPIINAYNFQVSLNFNYEDNLIALILPMIYLTMNTKKNFKTYLILAFLLFFSYFTKTSMFFLVLLVPLLVFVIEKKNNYKILPILSVFMAIIIWGFYGIKTTGKFPIGPSGSSFNSYVMAFSFNEKFHKFYPKYSTDRIGVEKPDRSIKDEWDFYEYYKNKNDEYFKHNKERLIRDLLIKLNFIFFNYQKDGLIDLKLETKTDYFSIVNRLFINFAVISLLYYIYKNILKRNISHRILDERFKYNLYFICLFLISIAPHLVVWATSKHLVGIINVCIIFIIFSHEKFLDLKRYKISNK